MISNQAGKLAQSKFKDSLCTHIIRNAEQLQIILRYPLIDLSSFPGKDDTRGRMIREVRMFLSESDPLAYEIYSKRIRSIPNTDFGVSFLISGVLAASFKTIVSPLERVKLILQTQTSSHQMTAGKTTAYSGLFNAFIRIRREQGFLSFWRGNFTNICRYFPSQAINFSLYDVYYRGFVQIIDPKTTRSRDLLSFLAGGAVGVTSCTILYPLTVCTTRISVDVGDSKRIEREFRSLNHCLYKVFKNDGFRGFYQGLSCSALGMFLYRAAYFGVYTTGKRIYLNDYSFDPTSHTVNLPILVSLSLAQLASVISTFISYPLDTISRQKMLWSGRGRENYVSLQYVVNRIIERDGFFGLYKGVFANLLTSVCGTLVLVGYDLAKGFYQRVEKEKANRAGKDPNRET